MDSSLEQIVLNLSVQHTRKTLQGRPHLVVPMSMIVPGVLNGSKGSLYYPPDEVAREPGMWNGMPIVVYHPSNESGNTSAREPGVVDSQEIGRVFNSHYDGKLRAEAWIDEELVKRVDRRVYDAVISNRPMDLSTGLYTDNYPASSGAAFNGRSYDFVARNYRPDHLAILPDEKGACSQDDGCGINVNSSGDSMVENEDDVTDDKWTALAKTVSMIENVFQPRSQVTGKIKKPNAGTGKGPVHEAAQSGHIMLTEYDRDLGNDAGTNNGSPLWATDNAKWSKAQTEAKKSHDGSADYWPVVAHIYTRLGGIVGDTVTNADEKGGEGGGCGIGAGGFQPGNTCAKGGEGPSADKPITEKQRKELMSDAKKGPRPRNEIDAILDKAAADKKAKEEADAKKLTAGKILKGGAKIAGKVALGAAKLALKGGWKVAKVLGGVVKDTVIDAISEGGAHGPGNMTPPRSSYGHTSDQLRGDFGLKSLDPENHPDNDDDKRTANSARITMNWCNQYGGTTCKDGGGTATKTKSSSKVKSPKLSKAPKITTKPSKRSVLRKISRKLRRLERLQRSTASAVSPPPPSVKQRARSIGVKVAIAVATGALSAVGGLIAKKLGGEGLSETVHTFLHHLVTHSNPEDRDADTLAELAIAIAHAEEERGEEFTDEEINAEVQRLLAGPTMNWCNQYGGTTCKEGTKGAEAQKKKDAAKGDKGKTKVSKKTSPKKDDHAADEAAIKAAHEAKVKEMTGKEAPKEAPKLAKEAAKPSRKELRRMADEILARAGKEETSGAEGPTPRPDSPKAQEIFDRAAGAGSAGPKPKLIKLPGDEHRGTDPSEFGKQYLEIRRMRLAHAHNSSGLTVGQVLNWCNQYGGDTCKDGNKATAKTSQAKSGSAKYLSAKAEQATSKATTAKQHLAASKAHGAAKEAYIRAGDAANKKGDGVLASEHYRKAGAHGISSLSHIDQAKNMKEAPQGRADRKSDRAGEHAEDRKRRNDAARRQISDEELRHFGRELNGNSAIRNLKVSAVLALARR